MLTLPTSAQIREADAFTISKQGISSADLMECASLAFVKVFTDCFPDRTLPLSVYCGTGNNGGDGLAIARLLKEQGYDRISVRIARFSANSTADFEFNRQRLNLTGILIIEMMDAGSLPSDDAEIVIEALLGSGLNKPLDGELEKLVAHLNGLDKTIVSVDVPAGFPSEGEIDLYSTIVKSDLVICFQRPKINFFFPESAAFIERFVVADIGLDEAFIQSLPGGRKLIEGNDIRKILRPRKRFTHKGTYGHALIIAGKPETMGAALLCAGACLHSGAGLTTACIPAAGLTALNSRSPEIMAVFRDGEDGIISLDFEKYQSIAAGPGLGTGATEQKLLCDLIGRAKCPLILDADALNILTENPGWLNLLPPETILTPHMKEFDRLFGEHASWWERIESARQNAADLGIIILLKNQYSFIALPSGDVFINPTGNPAMATGGMGDVLTGIIVALLAQGYKPAKAAIAACYIHGEAGNTLNEKGGMHSIPPGYLIRELPKTINSFIK